MYFDDYPSKSLHVIRQKQEHSKVFKGTYICSYICLKFESGSNHVVKFHPCSFPCCILIYTIASYIADQLTSQMITE